MFKFNTKLETFEILKKYFQQLNVQELKYYLNNFTTKPINEFLLANIYDPEDIELKNILLEHLLLVHSEIFDLITPLNKINSHINISFITDLIFWDDVFVIDDTIFINYAYIIRVFELIEYNLYKSADQVYILDNKIYDLELKNKLTISIYNILAFLNYDTWIDIILEKYNCKFITKSDIKFDKKYTIVLNPNTNFIFDKIPIYFIQEKIYGVFDSIISEPSYSPYYDTIIIELEYSEINQNFKVINSSMENKYDLVSNPFIDWSNKIYKII